MKPPYHWWRVEVDEKGGIVSCEQVDAEKEGTSRVTYVRARTRDDVINRAKGWHTRHLEYQRVSAKRLAARRKAQGQCRYCESPICEESGFMCERHLISMREAKRRHARGESKPRTRANSTALYQQQLADHRRRTRLNEQLPQIRAKYMALDGAPGIFLDWLDNEIAARESPMLRLVSSR